MKNLVEPIRNAENIQRIISYLEKQNLMYSVIFQIGIYSGLRISDIVGLDIFDVENKTFVDVVEKKTGKHKKFPLNEHLQKIIKDYLKIRKTKWAYEETKPLFIGKKHCRIDRSIVYRKIVEACYSLGIEGNFGTHTMRKTFGYHHYKQFKDPVLLQKIFNHSSPLITLRYIGIEQEDINNSYKDFEYAFDENKAEIREKYRKKYNSCFKEIEQGYEHLVNCYKELNRKIDKLIRYWEGK